jgi:hypothetical protein
MLTARFVLTCGLAFVSLVTACSNECARSESITIVYKGTEAGFSNWRNFQGGVCLGGVRGQLEDKAPPRYVGGVVGCYDDAAPTDTERVIEAWIDTDGDDTAICGSNVCDPLCGPDIGEPQRTWPVTLKARGKTEFVLDLVDP